MFNMLEFGVDKRFYLFLFTLWKLLKKPINKYIYVTFTFFKPISWLYYDNVYYLYQIREFMITNTVKYEIMEIKTNQ